MTPPVEEKTPNPRVIVLAGFTEGIDALARLISQLSRTFPLAIVTQLHGSQNQSITRLFMKNWNSSHKLQVVQAQKRERLRAGFVYVILPEDNLVFVAPDNLDVAEKQTDSHADNLFRSAAHWYQSGVIGVVLSGVGTDGTEGLLAITNVDGIRVTQSPIDATFPDMPSNALKGDHVQHSVMLDQMGELLVSLVAKPRPVEMMSDEMRAKGKARILMSGDPRMKSLDLSIFYVLKIMREELAMDIMFVTKHIGDDVIVSHSAEGLDEATIQGILVPKNQSLCHRVLEGRLPPVMPDVEALRAMHEVPILPIRVGAYMATPIWLQDGKLYGILCCLNTAVTPELGERHHRPLQMSARQIARLVNEAGGL